VADTAEVIREVVRQEMPEKGEIEIVTTPSDDIRSYRINSDKIRRVLDFAPRHTIEDGARDLIKAFRAGKLPDSMSDIRYSNIRMMKAIQLK
jgi:nucleoside-diphosphate-sugar epimerase